MSRFTVRKSTLADTEFRNIWRTIFQDNPVAADKVLLRLHRRIESLATFPELGPLRPDLHPGGRVLVEGNHIILYKIDTARHVIRIISVVDSRKDLSSL